MKKDATDVTGKTLRLTVEALQGKEGTVTVNGKEAAFDYKAPEITSVTVKGAKTIEVAFNEKLDAKTVKKAAFDVQKITGKAVDNNVQSAVLNADGKTVTIVLNTPLTVANYAVSLTKESEVADVAGNKMIVGTEETFKPTAEQVGQEAAPTVVKASYDVERGTVTLQLDKNAKTTDVTKLAINEVAFVDADLVAGEGTTELTITLSKETKAAVAALEGDLTLKVGKDAVEAEDGSKSEAAEYAIEVVKPATIQEAAYDQESRTLTVTFDQAVKIKTVGNIKVGESDTAKGLENVTVNGKAIPTLDKQTAATTWAFELENDLTVTNAEKLKVFMAEDAVQTEGEVTNAAVKYEDGVKVAYTKDETAPFVEKAELFHTEDAMELRLAMNEKVSNANEAEIILAVGTKAEDQVKLKASAGE